MSIDKILKHNILFSYTRVWNCVNLFFFYSNMIYDPQSLHITNSIDLLERLKPFFYYLITECIIRRNGDYIHSNTNLYFDDPDGSLMPDTVNTFLFFLKLR